MKIVLVELADTDTAIHYFKRIATLPRHEEPREAMHVACVVKHRDGMQITVGQGPTSLPVQYLQILF